MAITTEAVQQRIAELREAREQAILNVNAFNGAIEDCEYWLSVLTREESEESCGTATLSLS